MAQRYASPEAHERMSADLCPECGNRADQHSNSPEFWLRPGAACDLLPRGVRDRIAQYVADTSAALAPAPTPDDAEGKG